jgi:hypothetical protein
MSTEEEEMLRRFQLMTRGEKDFYLLSFRVCTEGREKKRPELKLLAPLPVGALRSSLS